MIWILHFQHFGKDATPELQEPAQSLERRCYPQRFSDNPPRPMKATDADTYHVSNPDRVWVGRVFFFSSQQFEGLESSSPQQNEDLASLCDLFWDGDL